MSNSILTLSGVVMGFLLLALCQKRKDSLREDFTSGCGCTNSKSSQPKSSMVKKHPVVQSLNNKVTPTYASNPFSNNSNNSNNTFDPLQYDVNVETKENYMPYNVNQTQDQETHTQYYLEPQNLLPVPNLVHSGMADSTQVNNPVVYDRHIFSNTKSRLRSNADMIRGDLAIQPILADTTDANSPIWFRPSAQPHKDLQTGALSSIGGIPNYTMQQLMQQSALRAMNNNPSL